MLSPQAASNENLLLGLVALQGQAITRAEFIAAVRQWAIDRSTTLTKILVDKRVMRSGELAAAATLADRLLDRHARDLDRTLASIECLRGIRAALDGVADDELQKCLERVDAIVPDETSAASEDGPTHPAAPRFRVKRVLAEGRLGSLYLARDEELDREVVVKEIQADLADNADCRARFEREVKYATELEHAGIVPIYGAGRYPDGRRYYAMRYIRGEDMRIAIRRCHDLLSATERTDRMRVLLEQFAAVCRAVAFAHERGVVHRDIKPENVMLSEDGEAIVVDWGLAKPIGKAATGVPDEATVVNPERAAPAITTIAQVVGTPGYMSPEQARGAHDLVGPRSDVYSLGATLYVLLTGDLPPPRQTWPDVPAALQSICLKAMAARPEDRHDSATELAKDIERWLAGAPEGKAVPSWSKAGRRRPRPLVAIAVTAICVATLAALSLGSLVYAGIFVIPGTDPGLPGDAIELRAERDAIAAERTDLQMQLKIVTEDREEARHQLADTSQDLATMQNNYAWLLSRSVRTVADASEAVELAARAYATNTDPQYRASFLNTLGVALYRRGVLHENKSPAAADLDWQSAQATLWKALVIFDQGRNAGDAPDDDQATTLYFLAMASWKLRQKVLANDCYDLAQALIKTRTPGFELAGFRKEAAEVLGRAGVQ